MSKAMLNPKLIGVCTQCTSNVKGSVGHKMDCSYGNHLYLAEHPEINFMDANQVKQMEEKALEEGWIRSDYDRTETL
jgi:hypothetical protein